MHLITQPRVSAAQADEWGGGLHTCSGEDVQSAQVDVLRRRPAAFATETRARAPAQQHTRRTAACTPPQRHPLDASLALHSLCRNCCSCTTQRRPPATDSTRARMMRSKRSAASSSCCRLLSPSPPRNHRRCTSACGHATPAVAIKSSTSRSWAARAAWRAGACSRDRRNAPPRMLARAPTAPPEAPPGRPRTRRDGDV